MRSEKEKIKEYVGTEIYNYIDYFTSNRSDRDKMKIVADKYMEEIYGDEKQELENIAYNKLRKIGYKVEMSEGYIPIEDRRYEVLTNRESIFKGNFEEFIKFANEQEEKI